MDDDAGVPHVYSLLQAEIDSLEHEIEICSVLEEKAELIGKLNQVRYSEDLLRRCEAFGVHPTSVFTALPPLVCEGTEYRVISDLDTDQRKDWVEVKKENGGFLRLWGGCVVVET